MNLSESFLTALDALLSNKLRSVLTMLGVIIGVASVIGLISIGNGVQSDITGEISSIGTNIIFINTDFDNSGGYPALSLSDVEALQQPGRAPDVISVAGAVSVNTEVVYEGTADNYSIVGVTPEYFGVNNLTELTAGDLLIENDIDTSSRVVVIGSEAAETIFGEQFAIGRSVKINGVSYEIVGVLAEKGGSIGSNPDESLYIPITTAQSRLSGNRTRSGEKAVSNIYAQAADETVADAAVNQIAEVLREEHGIIYADDDDFTVTSQTELLSTVNTITATLTIFLGAIAGISLVVGGIGIMNIMLVSVTERTREIGIRKAVGALRRDILAQFMIESMVLSLIGGLIGIALGWVISQVASYFLEFATVVDIGTVLLATSFAAGVGLVFGIYPAWRASNLRPIEALRYE